jgi:hypothetical protein
MGKGEEVPTLASTLEEMVVSPPVRTLATTLEVVSPMTLHLKGDGEEMPIVATTMEVAPVTLNLKGEEMPTHATTQEGLGLDSPSDAAACPTTTNSLRPTNPTTNTGQDSPKTSTRPTKTNAAEMPGMVAETLAHPMLPPHPLLRPSHRRAPHVSPALL